MSITSDIYQKEGHFFTTKAMELEMFSILLFLLVPIILFLTKKPSRKLPPGSMGLPIVGHSLGFLRAMRANKVEAWLQDRIEKYGPISKFNIIGRPTVFLHGLAANKFIFTSDSNTFGNNYPESVRKILGEKNMSELSGEDHKRVGEALVSFLKPEVLKRYVGKIDQVVREHLDTHWDRPNEEIIVMPLMKTLTFNIICLLIFGIGEGPRRDTLKDIVNQMMEGMISIPVNLPFTCFNRSLKARADYEIVISDLIREKKKALQTYGASSHQDLITCLLNSNRESDTTIISDQEIMDNVGAVMIAGHDTTSVLLTSLIRLFAMEPSIYAAVAQEQEEVAKTKHSREGLAWEDLVKMKYTWGVAMETLRMIPPAFCNFRTAARDIEYAGYVIPKGWQVIFAAGMTHMDEKIFKDPTKFDDKRFEQQPPPYSFIAFGGGPRICPGFEFAKIETLVMIHYLVTRFSWQLATNDTSYWRNPFPVFKHGLPIRITPKKL